MAGNKRADQRIRDEGLYAYCVLLDPEDVDPGMVGMEGNGPVYVVPYQRLGMAVSRVHLDEFAPERMREKLQNLAWVETRVRLHEEVVEGIMRDRSVVPIKFGTVYLDEKGVRDFLARHEGELSESLEELSGKEEWNVRVFVAKEGLRASIERSDERLLRMNREIEGMPPGWAYFLGKKKDLLLVEETERKLREWGEEFLGRLRGVAEEVVLNKRIPMNDAGGGGEMVLNVAFLVTRARLGEFCRALDELSDQYGEEGFSFRCSGPWPPYNFTPRLKEG